MSRSGSLNPEKTEIPEEKSEVGTDNMARRRSLPAVNIPALERLQQQDPAEGIENFLCSIDSNPEVGNSFDKITKYQVGSKQKKVWPIVYRFFSIKEKGCSLDCKENLRINTLIQSKLNVETVNEEFNQYDDLLNLLVTV